MIRMGDKYVIKGDGTCITAFDIMIRPNDGATWKAGDEYYRPFAHGSTLTEVLTSLAKRLKRNAISGDDVITLEEAIRRMQAVEHTIDALIKEGTGGV